jgi:hypothetical protein
LKQVLISAGDWFPDVFNLHIDIDEDGLPAAITGPISHIEPDFVLLLTKLYVFND